MKVSAIQFFNSFNRPVSLTALSERVIQWNFIANNESFANEEANRSKQWELVEEEADELFKAASDNDAVELLDAVCDLFVVSSYGLFLDRLKGVGSNIREAKKELFRDSVAKETSVSILELESIIYDSKSVYQAFRWSVDALYSLSVNSIEAFNEVMDSNDSKFPTKAEFHAAAVTVGHGSNPDKHFELECRRIEEMSGGRYKGITHKLINDPAKPGFFRVVFRDDSGKIMKPCTFRSPQLGKYIGK